MTESTSGTTTSGTTTSGTTCSNPVVDAVRSVLSAVGKDTTCDKSKGYLILIVGFVVLVLVLKFFVLNKR